MSEPMIVQYRGYELVCHARALDDGRFVVNRRIQHALRPLVRQKQSFNCGAELPIVAARPFQKRSALGRGGNFGRLKKDRLFRVQWC